MQTRLLYIAFAIVFVPMIVFEYGWLIWNWGGGGLFRLITTPLVLLLFFMVFIVLKKMLRQRLKKKMARVLNFSALLLLPILTVATTQAMAFLLGIKDAVA